MHLTTTIIGTIIPIDTRRELLKSQRLTKSSKTISSSGIFIGSNLNNLP